MMPMEDGFHKSFLLACVTFLACIEKLSSTMNAISVGRDWVGESWSSCTLLNRCCYRSS